MCIYKNIYLETLNDTFLAFIFYEKNTKSIIDVIKNDYDKPRSDGYYTVKVKEFLYGGGKNKSNKIIYSNIPQKEFKIFRRKIEIHKALFEKHSIEERSLSDKEIKKLYRERFLREARESVKKNHSLNEEEKEITTIDYTKVEYPEKLEIYSTRELLGMLDYARKFGYWYYEHPIYSYDHLKAVLSKREHIDKGKPQSKKTRRLKAIKNKGNSKSKSK